jgi:hypothetical protein
MKFNEFCSVLGPKTKRIAAWVRRCSLRASLADVRMSAMGGERALSMR